VTGRLLICTALGIEARAVRHGLPQDVRVIRTGLGVRRAARTAATLPPFGALAVVGFGGALDEDSRPGDVLVASEVRFRGQVSPCPSARALITELIRAGRPARAGPLITSDHVVTGAERRRLAAEGALAVDMEAGPLAWAAAGRPFAAVRVIVDTPGAPLFGPATVSGGRTALRALRELGPALAHWAATIATKTPPCAPQRKVRS
jgi:4-hydroxy-3-methylbut-2-en-1-yl diphosphate reductase